MWTRTLHANYEFYRHLQVSIGSYRNLLNNSRLFESINYPFDFFNGALSLSRKHRHRSRSGRSGDFLASATWVFSAFAEFLSGCTLSFYCDLSHGFKSTKKRVFFLFSVFLDFVIYFASVSGIKETGIAQARREIWSLVSKKSLGPLFRTALQLVFMQILSKFIKLLIINQETINITWITQFLLVTTGLHAIRLDKPFGDYKIKLTI